MSSSFGNLLKVTTFGESHGYGIGGVLDGCPAGVSLTLDDIQKQLDRRRPGQSGVFTQRKELDKISILSGLEEGKTLGTPIGFFIKNEDCNKADYVKIIDIPRPSHADYTYYVKYGVQTLTGGGRSSGRETAVRVAAGAIASKFLSDFYKIEIVAWVSKIGHISMSSIDEDMVSISDIDKSLVRCPDPNSSSRMLDLIEKVKDNKDSIGGIVSCVCRNVPAGWGEPVFDKLEALLAHAMMSIPASKGFEVGSGFSAANQKGSVHNDPFTYQDNQIKLEKNSSGGIQGGISTGDNVMFSVVFKPTPSIGKKQLTVDFEGNPVVLELRGRHDPCIVPRVVPVIEAMSALVLGDLALRNKPPL